MNKLIFTFIALFFLNNCSFNENSRIWKDKENKLETDKKITKVFAEENISVSEFNRDLKLDLSSLHSLQTFAQEIKDRNEKIYALICNAGVLDTR